MRSPLSASARVARKVQTGTNPLLRTSDAKAKGFSEVSSKVKARGVTELTSLPKAKVSPVIRRRPSLFPDRNSSTAMWKTARPNTSSLYKQLPTETMSSSWSGRWGPQGRRTTGGGGPARVPNLRACQHFGAAEEGGRAKKQFAVVPSVKSA